MKVSNTDMEIFKPDGTITEEECVRTGGYHWVREIKIAEWHQPYRYCNRCGKRQVGHERIDWEDI